MTGVGLCVGLALGIEFLGLVGLVGCSSNPAAARGAQDGNGGAAADGGTAGNSDTGAAGASGAAGNTSTGAAGASGSAGPVLGTTPGTFTPRTDLNPDASFDWKESLPGQGTCKAGKYTGTFQCTYTPMGGGGSTEVSGPVTLELTKSMNGEFLEVSNGQLDGAAVGVIGFSSMLSGKLDCGTLAFTADAVNGAYGFGDPKVFPLGTFKGGLTGKLDDQTLVLSGEWSLTEGSGGVCKGPWMASYTP